MSELREQAERAGQGLDVEALISARMEQVARAERAEAAIQRVRGIVDADQTVPIDARDPASYVAGYADATFRVRQVLDGQR